MWRCAPLHRLREGRRSRETKVRTTDPPPRRLGRRETSSGKYKPWTHTPITWHDLRHAFATFLVANGFASTIIEAWCGWADKKPMQRYLHYRPGRTELEMLTAAIRRDQERNVLVRSPTLGAIAAIASGDGPRI